MVRVVHTALIPHAKFELCQCSIPSHILETINGDHRESVLGISSYLTPQVIRVDTTDVASLLAVSMEAIAVHNYHQ